MKKRGYGEFMILLIEEDINFNKLAIILGLAEKEFNRILLGKGKEFTIEQFKIIRDIFNIKISDYF